MPQMPTVELPAMPRSAGYAMAGPRDDQPRLPLRGLTVLAVEDSRFASEALRLMCQRSGARLRRAETLTAARGHLRLYRPDVVIIDLGLPDGRGEVLIRDLVLLSPRPPLILGTSGHASGRASALAAGADGFLEKPMASLAAFQLAVAGLLPDPDPPLFQPDPLPHPDPLALRDDLTRAAERLAAGPDAVTQRYLAGFVQGIARQSQDRPLADAAETCASQGTPVDTLRQMIASRLASTSAGFDRQ